MYDYQLAAKGGRPELRPWAAAVPAFSYSRSLPYFQMLVPTVESARMAALLEGCLAVRRPLLLVGERQPSGRALGRRAARPRATSLLLPLAQWSAALQRASCPSAGAPLAQPPPSLPSPR